MRLLSSLALVASSSFFLACSLDTEQFAFDGAGGGATAGSAGTGGAGTGGSTGGTSNGGSAGSAEAGQAGAGGTMPGGAGGEQGGTAGTGGLGGGAGAGGLGGGAGAGGLGGAAGSAGAGGATSTCTPSLQNASRCADKTIETCDGTNWIPDETPCALGCLQMGVAAVCTTCVAGEVKCGGDLLQTCKGDGTAFDSVDCKANDEICDPTLKKCVACTPGSIVCGSGVAYVCKPSGAIDLMSGTTCGAASACEPGTGCKAAVCAAGEFQCSGAEIRNCLPDGTAFDTAKACPGAKQTCFDKVGCAECVQPPGSTFCVGDDSTACVDGQLKTLATCPPGKCGGSGTCTACTPDSVQCSADGKSIATCPASGTGFPAPTPCGGAKVCDQDLGACVACHPGELSCVKNDLMKCQGDGGSQALVSSCGAGLCDAVQGRCDECRLNERLCKSGVALVCDVNGDFKTGEKCATEALCDTTSGRCVDPKCKVGEVRCGPNGASEVCNADRTDFEKGKDCPHGCVDGPGCVTTVDLFAGTETTCAIVDAAARIPVCWGQSAFGLLVDSPDRVNVKPTPIKNLTGVSQMAISGSWACALLLTGEVKCWGANANGQLGQGDSMGRIDPVTVQLPGKSEVTQIASSNAGICALKGRDVFCWGANALETGVGANAPTQVAGVSNATAIDVGGSYRCFLNTAGEARCWGQNERGQLGTGTSTLPSVPPPPMPPFFAIGSPVTEKLGGGGGAVTTLSGLATGSTHACATLNGDTTVCWGSNGSGQLGVDSGAAIGEGAFSSVAIKGAPNNLLQVAASRDFTCGISSKNDVLCWGAAAALQTGVASGKSHHEPNTLAGPLASKIALGERHGCLLDLTGDVYCWGSNQAVQLGQPETTMSSATPLRVVFP